MKPQTIQIFLPDGHPTSIREAEITNRLVKAILIPRNKLAEAWNNKKYLYFFIYLTHSFDTIYSKHKHAKYRLNNPLYLTNDLQEVF